MSADDPFADLTPIERAGRPDHRPQQLRVSRLDATQRAALRKAQRVGVEGPAATPDGSGSAAGERPVPRLPRRKLRILPPSRLLEMASEMATIAHAGYTTGRCKVCGVAQPIGPCKARKCQGTSEVSKPADQKHYSVAFGVLADKIHVLQNRPGGEEVGAGSANELRPGVRDLALVIAATAGSGRAPRGGAEPA